MYSVMNLANLLLFNLYSVKSPQPKTSHCGPFAVYLLSQTSVLALGPD